MSELGVKNAVVRLRELNPDALGPDEDWEGNNVAIRCPVCAKVFIVNSTRMHGGYRKCPKCGKSGGRVTGGRKSGGSASVEWEG